VVGDNVVYYNNAWTCSPSGLPRYVVNGDGTLTDNQTGLMWELLTTTCGGEITCYNDVYRWTASGTAADGTLFTSFLATLNGGDSYSPSAGQDVSNGPSACFANHCDWRNPTIAEFNTIIETGAPGCSSSTAPCIDAAFGPTQAFAYWSSSSSVVDPHGVWAVTFFNGEVGNFYSKIPAMYARAVRTAR
jgi:hypothetical protein